jgi:anaerobic ribonucleoside-triphosphate reductase
MERNILDELVVVKRSGQRVPFNGSKIALAIKKGFDSVYSNSDEKKVNLVYENVLKYINNNYQDRKTINVEDIQDIIENILKEQNEDVYSSFSEYRKKREASRKAFGERQQHKFVKAMDNVVKEYNDSLSNLSSYDTLCKFGKSLLSEYTKSYILDSKFVRAQDEGYIYIHDLDYFYLGILPQVHLKLNFSNPDDSEFDNLLNIIISSQNEINNEIAIDAIDYLFAPWVLNNYRRILKKKINNYLNVYGIFNYINIKKIEELIDKEYNLDFDLYRYEQYILNTTTKNIFKQAFQDTLNELSDLVNRMFKRLLNALQKNKERDLKYTLSFGSNDTQIGMYINNAFINILENSNYLSSLHFIFKIRKDLNEKLLEEIINLIINQKNISLAFIDTTYNNDGIEYFENGIRILENYNSDRSEANGRLVVNTTSINLARLALKNKEKSLKEFYDNLDEQMELVKNELILSFEIIGDKNKENYSILFNGTIFDDEKLEEKQKIRKVIKSGNLNIGLIGLKECLEYLEPDKTKEYKLLIDILNHLNELCKNYTEKTKLNFGICELNDLNSRKELIAIDKAIYGIKSKITDHEYYDLITNLDFINKDYKKCGEIEKYFTHGISYTINTNNSNKKIKSIINELKDSDVGFVNINIKEAK